MKNRKKLVSILALIMAAVMVLSLILSLIPRASAATSGEIQQQINDLKGQKEEIRSQMADLQSQYQENEDEIANIVSKKNIIDQEIFLLYSEIGIINQQISAFNLLIADKQDELDAAQARFDTLSAEHRERIRAMEEEGAVSYWAVLFNASSFADLLDRLNMIEEIAASDQRRLEALDAAAKEVEAAQAALETEKAALEETKDELDTSYADLETKRQESSDLIAQLIAKGEEIEGLQAEYEAMEEALMSEIAAKEKEYNEAKRQEWLAYMATFVTTPPETTAPPTTPTTTRPPAGDGEDAEATEPGGEDGSEETDSTESTESTTPAPATWLVPCSYVKLTSPFGNREQPTAGASTYHQGVDLAGPEGTPIYASRTGIVTVAGTGSAAGHYVSINHGDGFSSIYMHMTYYVVSAGQAVSAGQLIGYMGSTGVSTGPHLHFGISYNGVYVNPAQYVPLY